MFAQEYQQEQLARDQYEADHPTAPAPAIPRTLTSLPVVKPRLQTTSHAFKRMDSLQDRFFTELSPSLASQGSSTSIDSGLPELGWELDSQRSSANVFSDASDSAPNSPPPYLRRHSSSLNVDAPDFKPSAMLQDLIRKVPASMDELAHRLERSTRLSAASLDSAWEDNETPLTPAEVKHALPTWMCAEVCQMKTRKTRRGCRGHRRNRRRKSASPEAQEEQ
eukprot:m.17825 g.17825  ORF g.17825 m.17825 type:complete len:222 (-) comp10700_c0_seq1:99-764(-)